MPDVPTWVPVYAALPAALAALVVAALSYLTSRQKTKLDMGKIRAETAKLELDMKTALKNIEAKQNLVPPQPENVLTGPLTACAVLKGAKDQYIEDAYPTTGDDGVHFVFTLFNANPFDFSVHAVQVDVLSFEPLNLAYLLHGVGATDVKRGFRATIGPELGRYAAAYMSGERKHEFVTIPPEKQEGFDVEITASTEGIYEICLRVIGDCGGRFFNDLLDVTKRKVVFFDRGAGYMVDRGGGKMLTWEEYSLEMKEYAPKYH